MTKQDSLALPPLTTVTKPFLGDVMMSHAGAVGRRRNRRKTLVNILQDSAASIAERGVVMRAMQRRSHNRVRHRSEDDTVSDPINARER